MTEDTIQNTFRFTEWRESDCDVCANRVSVVLLADERVCYDCLLTDFDESGDRIITDADLRDAFSNDWVQPTPARAVLAFLLAIALSGVALGNVCYELMRGMIR